MKMNIEMLRFCWGGFQYLTAGGKLEKFMFHTRCRGDFFIVTFELFQSVSVHAMTDMCEGAYCCICTAQLEVVLINKQLN